MEHYAATNKGNKGNKKEQTMVKRFKQRRTRTTWN
jgi:hypothetical protein